MAKLAFIFQGLTERFHANELSKILSQDGCKRVIASVAFVRIDGVDSVASELRTVASVSTFFIGIRNDITSVQAVKRLLELGVKVFAVDTASRSKIFHPKLFLAERKSNATLIVGSANMTQGGFHNNIEAGAILDLDLTTKDDKEFLQTVIKTLEEMHSRFPDNVFQIKDVAHAQELFDQGRLSDEDVVIAPVVTASVRKGQRDSLKAMKLPYHAPPPRKKSVIKSQSKAATATTEATSGFTQSKARINQFFEDTLGAKLKNPQQSWGAEDPHSNRVFLKVWEDQIKPDGAGKRVQICRKLPHNKSSGYAERRKHIDAMMKGAQGIGIVCRAVDTSANTREIDGFYDDPLLRLGRITEDENFLYAQIDGLIPLKELDQSHSPLEDGFVLVWESKGLAERDLNIPSGSKTNATGSMFWKKGATEGIDQRHFFRDEVFEGLDWKVDPKLPHYERTEADFVVVIKGLNYGNHRLKLSHNTNTQSAAYKQKNSMTEVHWGKVKKLVGKPDLLGRVMSLYRKEGNPPQYLIDID